MQYAQEQRDEPNRVYASCSGKARAARNAKTSSTVQSRMAFQSRPVPPCSRPKSFGCGFAIRAFARFVLSCRRIPHAESAACLGQRRRSSPRPSS